MSRSPTPQTQFEVAVHEGYQFTEKGHTKVKLLLSVADAPRQWVGWYVFAEGLIGPANRAYDDILMNNKFRADQAIQFGAGAIDRSPIKLRRPRAVDKLTSTGGKVAPMARIHDARFVPVRKDDGSESATIARLEMRLSIDVISGNDREIVPARVSMLSAERPNGNIHPATGYLMFAGHQRFVSSQHGPSTSVRAGVESPT